FIGGAVLITEPTVCLCLCVFLAPFFPTMAMAVIIGVTALCYGLKLMGGVEYRFRIDTTAILFIAFGMILLFFAVTGFAPAASLKIALLECLFIAAYPLMILLMDSRKKLNTVVFLYCLAALFVGLVGLYQYLSGTVNTTWTDTTLFEDLKLRVYSTFGNPNVYGEYLLLAIPMASVMCYIAKRPIMKIFYGGTALLLILNLGLTYSRGCYLAIMVAIFIVIWFGARHLMILCIPALAALPFVMPASIFSRFASIINFSDNSTSYRLSIWQGTVGMLEHYWMLGVGLGEEAFNTVYPLYAHDSIFAPHAHSLYLQCLSETGIGGFVLLICAFLAFLSIAYVAQRRVKGTKTMWFIIAMMAGVIAFLFQGVFDYVWYNYRVFLLFFITMGITGAVSYLVMKEGKAIFD
ncbi:MAG: O-antigen ligase family protein, partial [Bacillota bacterium]|nr:O-antigen ligase family protein [Bacillota bacterium]